MYRKLIIAAATLVVFAGPTLAADWNLIKSGPPTDQEASACLVVERGAATGEQKIAGPYASEALAMEALKTHAGCNAPTNTQQ